MDIQLPHRWMINGLSSLEEGPRNQRSFVFLDRGCKFGARAELLEAVEGDRVLLLHLSLEMFRLLSG